MLFVPTHFHRGVSQDVAVSQSAGTVISLSNGSAWLRTSTAFDGNTSQTGSVCAGGSGVSSAGFTNYIGKDWGAGIKKLISGLTMISASDNGFLGGPTASTWRLEGSNDGTNWDLLDSGSTAATTHQTITRTRSNVTMMQAYRMHRINISGNGANGVTMCELSFTEDVLK